MKKAKWKILSFKMGANIFPHHQNNTITCMLEVLLCTCLVVSIFLLQNWLLQWKALFDQSEFKEDVGLFQFHILIGISLQGWLLLIKTGFIFQPVWGKFKMNPQHPAKKLNSTVTPNSSQFDSCNTTVNLIVT